MQDLVQIRFARSLPAHAVLLSSFPDSELKISRGLRPINRIPGGRVRAFKAEYTANFSLLFFFVGVVKTLISVSEQYMG